jgi:hypothetical protein
LKQNQERAAMANKTFGTRQKLGFRIEPSQRLAKPRNPLALAARQRAAGAHGKSGAATRQAARMALLKKLGAAGSD